MQQEPFAGFEPPEASGRGRRVEELIVGVGAHSLLVDSWDLLAGLVVGAASAELVADGGVGGIRVENSAGDHGLTPQNSAPVSTAGSM